MNGLIADIEVMVPETSDESCDMRVSLDGSNKLARKLYIESYGCQMNFSDSEIVTSILKKEGFDTTSKM